MKMKVQQIIEEMQKEWVAPKHAIHNGVKSPFRLSCSFKTKTLLSQEHAWGHIPNELKCFWSVVESAELFKDIDYGQWGLRIFSLCDTQQKTLEYEEQRSRDFLPGDLMIGSFMGDSEILIVRTDRSSRDYGSILVALPLDNREDWYVVGRDFSEFLNAYYHGQGSKFWEENRKTS